MSTASNHRVVIAAGEKTAGGGLTLPIVGLASRRSC